MGKLKQKLTKSEGKALCAARRQAEDEAKEARKAEQAACRTKVDLVALARRRGYAQPEWWADKVWAGRKKWR